METVNKLFKYLFSHRINLNLDFVTQNMHLNCFFFCLFVIFFSAVTCMLYEIDPKHLCHATDCDHCGGQVIDCVSLAGLRGSRGTPCHAPLLKFLAGRSQETSDSKWRRHTAINALRPTSELAVTKPEVQ